MDRLGPDIFSTLRMKGRVSLHGHVWNAFLTKKLRIFLSRFNEINGGCEKILPVSGSFRSNLQFPGRGHTYFHYGHYISLHRHP